MNRQITGFIRKEFTQVVRDRNILRVIFVMPIIQLLLFGYVANTDVKNIALRYHDFDNSPLSREFIDAFRAGDYFAPEPSDRPVYDLNKHFVATEADMVLVIPADFSEKFADKKRVTVGLIADGSNANSTNIGVGYASRIANQFSLDKLNIEPPVEMSRRVLYNPHQETVYFMVPGIVATLLTMVTIMLTSMAIVRESERGTLEQILVTPISTWTLLLGKTIPFAILGIVVMAITLSLGIVWFHVPFAGSVLLLAGLGSLFLLTTLGIGLLISTATRTQQQAMFFGWFFMVFSMLTSGFFTPIANMPQFLQYLTLINPMRFFLVIVRGIMMKGAGMTDLYPEALALLVLGGIIFSLAAYRFHRRLG
jgi:ABC-2 type transport system permease protein